MVNGRYDDPRGEIIGSEYVVPPDAGLEDAPRFVRERIRPAPRVLSADEERVLRRNRDLFFGAERRAELDEWLWEPKRQCWVQQVATGRQADLDNVDRVRQKYGGNSENR